MKKTNRNFANMGTVPVEVIAKALSSTSSFLDSWRTYARHLQIDDKNLMKTHLQNSTETDSQTYYNLTKALLSEFVAKLGENATIEKLISVSTQLEKENIVKILKSFPHQTARLATGQSGVNLPPEVVPVIEAVKNEELQENNAPGKLKLMHVLQNADPRLGRVEIFLSCLLQLLSKVGDRPVAIVSINGTMRTGKSFMANNFVKYLKHKNDQNWLDKELPEGFHFAAGATRVTSGIEAWNEPLLIKTKNGKEVAVIILDTQGLHDLQTDTKENKIIFGLSALLSSVFIFNEKSVNSLMLQDLHSSLEFAKFAGASDTNMKFQRMILLLRDFDRPLMQYEYGHYDKNYVGDRNLRIHYFDTETQSPEVNATRSGISNCFEELSLYAMASPESRRPDIPEFLKSDSWAPDLKKTVQEFTEMVFGLDNIVKTVYGEEMTGKGFQHFVKMWTELILDSEGDLQFKTIVETSAEIMYSRKIVKFVEDFEQKMQANIKNNSKGIPAQAFEAFAKENKTTQVNAFDKLKVFGSPVIQANFKLKLQEKLDDLITTFKSTNNANLDKEAKRIAELNRLKSERIAVAERHLNQATTDLEVAKANQAHIMATRGNYRKPVPRSKRNRFLGISIGHTSYTDWEFDAVSYNQALTVANNQIDEKTRRYNKAVAELNRQRNFVIL